MTVQSGDKNPNWRGGRSLASNGYVLVRVGVDHPLADVRGYAYEHRVVAVKKLKRMLRDDEVVHHRDGNKQNNAPENLEVLTHPEHHAEHRRSDRALRDPGEDNPRVLCECGCGTSFDRYDSAGRPRRFVSGHNGHESPVTDAIRAFLESTDEPVDRRTIAESVGMKVRTLAVALTRMKRSGIAEPVGGGKWRLARG